MSAASATLEELLAQAGGPARRKQIGVYVRQEIAWQQENPRPKRKPRKGKAR